MNREFPWFIFTELCLGRPRWSTESWWTGTAPSGWTPPLSSWTPPWTTPASCRAIWAIFKTVTWDLTHGIKSIYYLPADVDAAQDDFVNTDNEVNMSFDQPCELQPRCYSCSSVSDMGAYDTSGVYSSTYS